MVGGDRVRPTSGVLSLSAMTMSRRPVIQIVCCTSLSTLINFVAIFVLISTMFPSEAIVLAPVHWNSSNPT